MSLRETRDKVEDYVFNSTARSSDRGGCPPVTGESLHSHAGFHQVHPEWRRGHCGRPVATECFCAVSFPIENRRWGVKAEPIVSMS